MTDDDKPKVRRTIEHIWTAYNARVRNLDHELIVLAVPRYPGPIEAVSAMDLQDVTALLETFVEHRKANPDELHPFERKPREAPEPLGEKEHKVEQHRQATPSGPPALGQGHDGRGPPQERIEPPAEPHEGDAAANPVEVRKTDV